VAITREGWKWENTLFFYGANLGYFQLQEAFWNLLDPTNWIVLWGLCIVRTCLKAQTILMLPCSQVLRSFQSQPTSFDHRELGQILMRLHCSLDLLLIPIVGCSSLLGFKRTDLWHKALDGLFILKPLSNFHEVSKKIYWKRFWIWLLDSGF